MIANIIRYDLEVLQSLSGVDHLQDYVIEQDPDASGEKFSISVWNEPKLGPQKTLAQYRTIGQSPGFQTWHEDYTDPMKKKRRKAREFFEDTRERITIRAIATLTGKTIPEVKAAYQQAIIDEIQP